MSGGVRIVGDVGSVGMSDGSALKRKTARKSREESVQLVQQTTDRPARSDSITTDELWRI